MLSTWFHLPPCKRWHLLGSLAWTARLSQNRAQLLCEQTSGKVLICSIVLLNKIKISKSSIKVVFKLSMTGASLIIYSVYQAIVSYFINCCKRGKTLTGPFETSFGIIVLWHLPGLFHSHNTSLLIRRGVLTSGSKYMLLPINCVCTNLFFSFCYLFSFSFLLFSFFLFLFPEKSL